MGPKKSRFQGPLLQTAREMDFPPSKSICPATYKKQVHYIGNFMDQCVGEGREEGRGEFRLRPSRTAKTQKTDPSVLSLQKSSSLSISSIAITNPLYLLDDVSIPFFRPLLPLSFQKLIFIVGHKIVTSLLVTVTSLLGNVTR